ncbi:hypothetical protein AB3M83_10135 [Microbacterium sp. 179-B 1A2 NHS]|uniref:hypothetical protein n=1 Tax=Microbacterium sp. 179-B 1A2 NHS TaxID=3142383 RepID=UPI0039A04704
MWLTTVLAAPLALALSTGASGCGAESVWTSCDSSNNGSSVTIDASKVTRDVDRSPGGSRPPGTPDGGGPGGPVRHEEADRVYPGGLTFEEWIARCPYDSVCRGTTPVADDEPEAGDPAEPGVDITTATIGDVAAYAPASPSFVAEPDGVGVVGMPTNFVVDAGPESVDGAIFGVPVTVRFTPVSYLFHYGDGASQETTTPGTEWADLDAPQFSATATSHSYGEPGDYTARVEVRYAAAGNAGFGWFPIAGLLTVESAGTGIRVVEVETALVDRSCDEDPGGPGC